MDYTQVFNNLNTSKKQRKHYPHKAVLLLALIEMFEEELITKNELLYDDSLQIRFHQIWNRFIGDEEQFNATPHLPFWFLNSDGFWHLVANEGKQFLVQALIQSNVKPSESKLMECIKCATLDEDLYFQFSLPSSRKTYRTILLTNYLYLSTEEIIEYLKERSTLCIRKEELAPTGVSDISDEQKFYELNEDLQISLNIEYYTFLKNNRELREQFKRICPSPSALYRNIAITPIKKGEFEGIFEYSYSSFLRDMSLSMMSNDYAVSFVETIDKAVDILEGLADCEETAALVDQSINPKELSTAINDNPEEKADYSQLILDSFDKVENEKNQKKEASVPEYLQSDTEPAKVQNRRGMPWTEDEEEQIKDLYNRGYSFEQIAETVGRTDIAIKSRLGIMGVVDYSYEDENVTKDTLTDSKDNPNIQKKQEIMTGPDFFIENSAGRCFIYNNKGERVFSSYGKLKIINGTPYKIRYSNAILIINAISKNDHIYATGELLFRASKKSPLYKSIYSPDALEDIENILFDFKKNKYIIQVNGELFDKNGNSIQTKKENANEEKLKVSVTPTTPISNKRKIWMYWPGDEAYLFPLNMRKGFMGCGLPSGHDIGDINKFGLRKIDSAVITEYGTLNGAAVKLMSDIYDGIKKGDIVIARDGFDAIVGIGVVSGSYYYDDTQTDFKHCRPVEWILTSRRKFPSELKRSGKWHRVTLIDQHYKQIAEDFIKKVCGKLSK